MTPCWRCTGQSRGRYQVWSVERGEALSVCYGCMERARMAGEMVLRGRYVVRPAALKTRASHERASARRAS